MTEQYLIEMACVLFGIVILKVLLVTTDYLSSPPSRDYRGDKHW